jgi:dolichol kinase
MLERLFSPPTTSEWIYLLVLISGIGSFIGLAEFIRSCFRWSPKVTRKLVHILVGVVIYFTPFLFIHPLPLIILALIFIVVNFGALRLGMFKGMHDTTRVTYGTVAYPLSFLILVVWLWHNNSFIVATAILVLAIGDALAAIVGEALKHPRVFRLTTDKKSIEGSVVVFGGSLVVVAGSFLLQNVSVGVGFSFLDILIILLV